MSQPCLHCVVLPYRTHSHHSMMKGDHPPLFGFQQMQAIIRSAEAPMVKVFLKPLKRCGVPHNQAPKIHHINSEFLCFFPPDVISCSSCQGGCSSFCKCLLFFCQQPLLRTLHSNMFANLVSCRSDTKVDQLNLSMSQPSVCNTDYTMEGDLIFTGKNDNFVLLCHPLATPLKCL